MRLTVPFREQLPPAIGSVFDVLIARINTVFNKEHNNDGTHAVVTATSVTTTGAIVGGSTVAATGAITAASLTTTGAVAAGTSLAAGTSVVAGTTVAAGTTVTAGTTLKERARSTPVGEWQDVAYNAGNFTASAGTWGVDAADQVTFQYMLVGKTMWVAFVINQTDVTNAGVSLRITIPGGFTAAKTSRQYLRVIDAGAAGASGMAVITAATTVIECFSSPAAAGFAITAADNTNVAGVVCFEVQ